MDKAWGKLNRLVLAWPSTHMKWQNKSTLCCNDGWYGTNKRPCWHMLFSAIWSGLITTVLYPVCIKLGGGWCRRCSWLTTTRSYVNGPTLVKCEYWPDHEAVWYTHPREGREWWTSDDNPQRSEGCRTTCSIICHVSSPLSSLSNSNARLPWPHCKCTQLVCGTCVYGWVDWTRWNFGANLTGLTTLQQGLAQGHLLSVVQIAIRNSHIVIT